MSWTDSRSGDALSIVEFLGRGARNGDSGLHLQNNKNTRKFQTHAKVGRNRQSPRYTPVYFTPYTDASSSASAGGAPYLPRFYHAFVRYELIRKAILLLKPTPTTLLPRSVASAPALLEEAHDRASRPVLAVVRRVCGILLGIYRCPPVLFVLGASW